MYAWNPCKRRAEINYYIRNIDNLFIQRLSSYDDNKIFIKGHIYTKMFLNIIQNLFSKKYQNISNHVRLRKKVDNNLIKKIGLLRNITIKYYIYSFLGM